jgi:hypothetical protein
MDLGVSINPSSTEGDRGNHGLAQALDPAQVLRTGLTNRRHRIVVNPMSYGYAERSTSRDVLVLDHNEYVGALHAGLIDSVSQREEIVRSYPALGTRYLETEISHGLCVNPERVVLTNGADDAIYPAQSPDFDGEEVRSGKHTPVGFEKLVPCHSLASFWSRIN